MAIEVRVLHHNGVFWEALAGWRGEFQP